MTAQKALVIDNSPWTQGDALVDLAAQHLTPAQATAVRKDLLITGLAMATDRRVLSLDDTQRRLLCTLSTHLPTLCELYWANPQQPTTLNWLEAGAPELPALQVQST